MLLNAAFVETRSVLAQPVLTIPSCSKLVFLWTIALKHTDLQGGQEGPDYSDSGLNLATDITH